MFRTRVAFALALSLLLAQSRLAPHALAQSRPADARPQSPATDERQQIPATAQAAQPATPPQSQPPSPLDKHAAKIKRAVERIGLSQTITVIIEDGDDLHGSVKYIGEEEFDIAEADQRRLVTVRYSDVKKVRGGYGGIAPLTGQRTSHPRGVKIAAFAGLAALIALPLIILGTAKE